MNRSFVQSLLLGTFNLLSIAALTACSASFAPSATPTPTASSAPAATATTTATPTKTPLPTSTPNATATVLAQAREDMMNGLFSDGYITWQNGKHFHLDDFTENWAEIGYFNQWPTGFSPQDFVFKTDFAWETGSTSPDLSISGCGFAFHVEDGDNQYMIFLGLDGYVHGIRFSAGRFGSMGQGYYGKLSNPGHATFTLAASGNKFHIFVNDKFVKTFTGLQGKLVSGKLAYAVISGTNKSFGTRCTLTNTYLWYPDN